MADGEGRDVTATFSILKTGSGPKFTVSLQRGEETVGDVLDDSSVRAMQRVNAMLRPGSKDGAGAGAGAVTPFLNLAAMALIEGLPQRPR